MKPFNYISINPNVIQTIIKIKNFEYINLLIFHRVTTQQTSPSIKILAIKASE